MCTIFHQPKCNSGPGRLISPTGRGLVYLGGCSPADPDTATLCAHLNCIKAANIYKLSDAAPVVLVR